MPSSVTDHPEFNPDRDSFGRHAFARRLATLLLLPAPRASLVVGLYGKWGEGKSTVLHFVEHELRAVTPPPVMLHLNPWRFPQEDQLLLDFFQQLTASLGQHLKSKGENLRRPSPGTRPHYCRPSAWAWPPRTRASPCKLSVRSRNRA